MGPFLHRHRLHLPDDVVRARDHRGLDLRLRVRTLHFQGGLKQTAAPRCWDLLRILFTCIDIVDTVRVWSLWILAQVVRVLDHRRLRGHEPTDDRTLVAAVCIIASRRPHPRRGSGSAVNRDSHVLQEAQERPSGAPLRVGAERDRTSADLPHRELRDNGGGLLSARLHDAGHSATSGHFVDVQRLVPGPNPLATD